MRILLLNNEFPPLGGGTATVNEILLRHLSALPWIEIDVVTSANGQTAEKVQFADNIRIFKVPVKNKNIHHAGNLGLLSYTSQALRLALKLHRSHPYDLCFAWSALPAGFVALVLNKLTGLEYILRICGSDIPGFEKRYQKLYPFLSPIIKSTWHGAEKIVAKCADEAEMIHEIDRSIQVDLIPNGADLSKFQPGAKSSPQEPLRLICVARQIERKGQPYLIRAVRKLRNEGIDVTLDLIGDGDSLERNKRLVASLNLQDYVRLPGYVSRNEIPEHYASSDVFVLYSYNEGMSVATLEAMAAGLPIVVTQTPGTRELVEEGINGWTFQWGDSDLLTAHLRKLSENRDLVQTMGSASREIASSFSWNEIANKYLTLFQKVSKQAQISQLKHQVNIGYRSIFDALPAYVQSPRREG